MAAPGKKIFPLGLEAGRIYKLNTDGLPAASSTAPYDGVAIGGPTVFAMENVEREQVAHPGNNGVLQYDSLPGIAPLAGSLAGSRIDLDTLALVTDTTVRVTGETNRVLRMTDTEDAGLPDFGLVLYTQAKGKTGSTRTYLTKVFPSVTLAPQNSGMQRERQDPTNYQITFSKVTADLTGEDFTALADGALSGVYLEMESYYRQHYVAFLADGTEDEYSFTATLQAANTTDMQVYVDGVERTTNLTKATSKITFTSSIPAANSLIVVRYPLATTAVDIE